MAMTHYANVWHVAVRIVLLRFCVLDPHSFG